ncbi:MAG: hypothetical protein LAO04_17145 [Acidobacteriia bacterium]|nr:hypothetical protein [Terriglobia bacterium]
MVRSISIVEYKVEQARFFLEQIAQSSLSFFAVQCFTDAFASNCRSITLSMQAVINEVDGFKEWYAARMELLRKDPLSQFFNDYRVVSIHIGDTVVRGGTNFIDKGGNRVRQYLFMPIPDVPNVPSEDVLSICRTHFTNLVRVVYDAFEEFRCELDDRWYYTEDHFRRMGKSFEDAVEELGFPREWLAASSGLPESERWRALRRTQTVGCQLNAVFESYLGKAIRGPDETAEQTDASE